MATKYNWINPNLEVKRSKIEGKGVFAKEDITRGTRLAIFGGRIMFIEDIKNLPKDFQEYTMQIEERFVIGPHQTQTEIEDTDYFNHSCEPNSGFKGQIFLVAMNDIQKNEEVTFDYAMVVSESIGSDVEFKIKCNCGSSNCRKIITENDWKFPSLQKKYKGFFSQYIQEKLFSENIKP